MKRLPQISEAEFEVMKIVWKHAPACKGKRIYRSGKQFLFESFL